MSEEMKADPGMSVKMGAQSVPGLSRILAGGEVPRPAVEQLLGYVDARLDCADFRMAIILLLLCEKPAGLPDDLAERMKRSVLGFKYWMDEPGDDGMCYWSENHQVLFAVCEYLAGQLYPQDRFAGRGLIGEQRRDRGEARLRRWLEHRFRFGFTEWCSTTYYEEDVAALALFISYAVDAELVERARIILDLVLLDMALHRYNGRLAGTAGRAYELQKKRPDRADVNDILAHAFGADGYRYDDERLSAAFVLGHNYEVPRAIREIADAPGTYVIKESTGLAVSEVPRHFPDPHDVETTGAFWWLMEAFTNPESIESVVHALRTWRMQRNRFLAPLRPLAALHRIGPLRPLLPLIVRTMNPATQGVAIQRANIYAFRTPDYHLSSAVHHFPGTFGDQQHIWQATLPKDITVFATHPGAPMFDNNARNFSPSAWVGNGRNPEVGQHENVLVALYDVRGRKGYLERGRQQLSHLYFPFVAFDETKLGSTWVAGRVGESFIGVRSLGTLEMVAGDELMQRGEVTGYGVLCAGGLDFHNFRDFVSVLKETTLRYRRGRLAFGTPQGRYEARWRRGFWRDGRKQPHDFDRFETPWMRTKRFPTEIVVSCHGHRLTLDWAAGSRIQDEC